MKQAALLFFLLTFFWLTTLAAQEEHRHLPGEHEKIGKVHFPVSCNEAPVKMDAYF